MILDERMLRLIAVGASISANCQPCLQNSVAKALESGADEQEIADAVEIGRMVRKGASSKMDKFAASLGQAVPAAAGEADAGCGCAS